LVLDKQCKNDNVLALFFTVFITVQAYYSRKVINEAKVWWFLINIIILHQHAGICQFYASVADFGLMYYYGRLPDFSEREDHYVLLMFLIYLFICAFV